MPEGKDWRILVEDMREHARHARGHASGMTLETFAADLKTVHAVTRCVEIIGEAARHVPDEVRGRAPDVPWAQIVGTRHILAHHYGRVDPVILWKLVTERMDALDAALTKLLDP